MNQNFQHRLYESLQLIYTLIKSFHIIIINFILILSKIVAEKDCIILIIDKFSKIITFIIDETR